MRIDFAPFAAISVLLILAPGPDTAVVTKNALLGGRRSGVLTAVGVALGLVSWTVAAALGLAALLRASHLAFSTVRLAGAAYLIWLGVQTLRSARRGGAEGDMVAGGRARLRGRKALRQGFLSDLGNPKIAVFFTSFLPQFVHGGGSALPALLLLGGSFCAMTLLWLAAYGALVDRAAAVIRRPVVRRTLDGVTGIVLVGFGIRLATEHGS